MSSTATPIASNPPTAGQMTSASVLASAMPTLVGGALTLKRAGTRRATLTSVDARLVALTIDVPARELNDVLAAAMPSGSGRSNIATVSLRTPAGELVFFADVVSAVPETDGAPFAPTRVQVVLRTPAEVIPTQRRKSFRMAVTPDDAISMHLWRIDDHVQLSDRPQASRELKSELRNLSEGGLGALVHAPRVASLSLVEGQRFRITLKSGDVEMLLEGRQRHPRSTGRDDTTAMVGVEFLHDDTDIESRRNQQKLLALLSEIQRNAARRTAD